MVDTTDEVVLMNCTNCGYEENVPLKDLEILRKMYPNTEDSVFCPSCLSDMDRKDSKHFQYK